MKNTAEIKWINCAKAIAIMAVLTDHTNGVLYENQNLAFASYFSVSLFIIISGMMSFLSNKRHELGWFQTFIKSSKSIIIAYLIANAVYLVWDKQFFDINIYLRFLTKFNLSGPFYYVLLYLQLMLINRVLYGVLQRIPDKNGWVWEIAIGIVILFISALTTKYTDIFGVYGGGGKLLGGTYLFLFYLGMLISKHDVFRNLTVKKSLILAVVGCVLWFVWWRFACYDKLALDGKLPFGDGFNPPSITFSLMGIFMLIFACGVFSLLEKFKYLSWITTFIAWIGKHTLYIFLYHRLFIDFILVKLSLDDNMPLKRVVYICAMIFGSIIIEYIINHTGRVIAKPDAFSKKAKT